MFKCKVFVPSAESLLTFANPQFNQLVIDMGLLLSLMCAAVRIFIEFIGMLAAAPRGPLQKPVRPDE